MFGNIIEVSSPYKLAIVFTIAIAKMLRAPPFLSHNRGWKQTFLPLEKTDTEAVSDTQPLNRYAIKQADNQEQPNDYNADN